MKANKTWMGVLIAILFCISSPTKAYDPRYSSYDQDWLYGEVEKTVPEGWNCNWLQIETLDAESDKEYVIVSYLRHDPAFQPGSESALQNQLAVYTVVADTLHLVWRSDHFNGRINNFEYEDGDNNGRKNINVYLMLEESEERVGRLRMYDWNGSNTTKIYPEANMSALDPSGMRYWDFDEDGNQEIVLRDNQKEYLYLFKDGQLQLKKVIDVTPPTWSAQTPIESQYPEIAQIVQEKGYGIIDIILAYYGGKIFLVLVENKEGSTYLIFGKDQMGYRFWYALGEQFSSLHYSSHDEDFNADGDFDLVLEKYESMSEPICYYYIITLRPSGYQLISPIDEDFYSQMWCNMHLGSLGYGTYGLMSNIYYQDQYAVVDNL